MKAKKDPTAWRDSPTGHAAYLTCRKEAQENADRYGIDYGIEANDLFKSWRCFMLPRVGNRFGHELRCEVVVSRTAMTVRKSTEHKE
jgi:hypothetical protein